MPRRTPFVIALLLVTLGGCEKPESVELGGACKTSEQCKAPADTCMTIGDKSTCTMTCTKAEPCPDTFVCAVTDPSNRKRGSCLPDSSVSRDTVKVK